MKDVGQGMSHNMSKGENLRKSQPGCSLQYQTIVANGLDHVESTLLTHYLYRKSRCG